MKLSVIKAYMLKEFKDLIRTKMIFLVYLIPTMIMLLFGYGIRLEVKHARTIIIDQDQSRLSKRLVEAFSHSQYFDTKISYTSYNEALEQIKKANADILIIIPGNFERRLFHGQKTQIAAFIDAAFPLRSMTMQGYVEGTILHEAQKLAQRFGMQKGLIEINPRNLFNQSMRDENAIVPGLIGLILLVAPALLSALLIVKEKEMGTIFNFYASPVKRSEFLIAKLTPVFLLHSLNIFILFLWATAWFEVPFRGSFFLYWIVSEIYILISLSIGLLVSIITKRQIVAVVLTIIITVIPGFLYSGILMPISSMVGESYIEAHIFPVMYYNHIIYDTFLIGQGVASQKNILYFAIMIGYALLLLIIGSLLLKKELR
ncbi:ABC transporter permease [Nitratiruptor sp. SB155-2]|uniref:ABC transporter permease n=1 Tax=Nitratiruptor sp. (strain SB155-2) TaxID=387092 RepID=UPI0001587038|nr:ABC transporter permease [Nitratiruptor sp. SB155-2]BAF70832.1 multidrug ABC transporter [Nitratiruptor sp. SB155-2]